MKKNGLSLFIQAILMGALLIFYIVSFFLPDLRIMLQYLMSAILIIMSYNNVHFYKRKYVTFLYLIVGVGLLITTIING